MESLNPSKLSYGNFPARQPLFCFLTAFGLGEIVRPIYDLSFLSYFSKIQVYAI